MGKKRLWRKIYNMKKIFLTLLIGLGVLFVTQTAMAADDNISCTDSGCTPSTITHFFSSSEVWYPGKTLTKTIQITNTSGSSQKIGADTSGETTTGGLDQVLNLVITRSDSTIAWSGLLSAFYTNGETELLSSLGNGSSDTFAFALTMDSDAGNAYQNTSTQFDLTLGFISPLTGKTSSLSTSCTNSDFDAIMELKYDGVLQSGINVKFTYKGEVKEAVTGSNGKAQVGYTHTGDDTVNAEPENGYPSKSVTINASSCTTPTSTPIPPTLTPTPEGFVPSITPAPTAVLGASTSSSKSSQEGVQGATTKKCDFIWWQILLGEGLLAALYFFRFAKNMSKKTPIAVGALMAALSLILFRLLNKCLTYSYLLFPNTESVFGRYFILADVLMVITIMLLWMRSLQKTNLSHPE